MSYVLDGIQTAMKPTSKIVDHPSEPDRYFDEVRCPCGWRGHHHAALRFHFTHCPQAKLPTPQDEP